MSEDANNKHHFCPDCGQALSRRQAERCREQDNDIKHPPTETKDESVQ